MKRRRCNECKAVLHTRNINIVECRSCKIKQASSLIESRFCKICNIELQHKLHSCYSKRNFCSSKCASLGRKGRKHSEETKKKIAIGNMQPCSNEKREKIRVSNTKNISDEQIKKLNELWLLQYISDNEILRLTNVPKKAYFRTKKIYCTHKQVKFLPRDMTKLECEKILELAKNNIHYEDIAFEVNRGKKQIFNILTKFKNLLGITFNKRKNTYTNEFREPKTEKFIRLLLDENNVQYTQWKMIELNSKWEFDFYIHGTNILVEVNGDYFHCNRDVYVNGPINEWQKHSIRRDFVKRRYAEALGYRVVYIWEKDIREKNERLERHIRNFKNEIDVKKAI